MNITKKAFPMLLITIFLGISFIIGFIYTSQNQVENNIRVKNYQELFLKTAYYNSSSSPINIDGDASGVGAHNWTWAKNQPWCSGSGLWGDPYIIENLSINGQNLESCIKIFNSDVFFQIKNCTVYNSSRGSFPSYKAGIELQDVDNGIIENCSIYDNSGYGISLWLCKNNTMKNNKINNDEIWNQNSDQNFILNNTFTNVDGGIWLESGSTNNIVARNIFLDSYDGIDCYDDNNEILKNTFLNCESAILGLGNNNSILNNTISYCGSGISFQSGNNNTIKYNIIKNGYQESYNIRLFESSNFNNVSYNIIINNSADGILIRNSQYNILFNNTIKNNSKYGINLDGCNYTSVRYNMLIENIDGCINEQNCVGSVFESNICVEVPSDGNGEDPLIFGFNIYILLSLILILTLILVIRIGKAQINDKIN
ncbi:MAG: hypothetical protein GF317_06880 [Candidatus Lokiarchaeota archaeon]|nr:hypothetical protein [Candidatus Lokiarchaeota archaeon]MBD3199434.1 hypothetical protein [Candidatus Lokiarchaeota archaeon]